MCGLIGWLANLVLSFSATGVAPCRTCRTLSPSADRRCQSINRSLRRLGGWRSARRRSAPRCLGRLNSNSSNNNSNSNSKISNGSRDSRQLPSSPVGPQVTAPGDRRRENYRRWWREFGDFRSLVICYHRFGSVLAGGNAAGVMNHLRGFRLERLSVSSDSEAGREGGGENGTRTRAVDGSIAKPYRCDDSCLSLT